MLTVIRGAGDIATGAALRLWRSGIQVVMTDLPAPTAIRRTVCFSQAILFGSAEVEDVTAVRAATLEDVRAALENGQIPVLADPAADSLRAKLRAIDLNVLTPIEAMNKLYELCEEANRS